MRAAGARRLPRARSEPALSAQALSEQRRAATQQAGRQAGRPAGRRGPTRAWMAAVLSGSTCSATERQPQAAAIASACA